MRLLIGIFIFITHANLFGQGFNMHYSNSFADCFGAVEVTDYDSPSYVQFPGNFGQRDDFIEIDPDFHEVNSVWLRLEPNVNGTFEFEISTENNVDFSYFLFKAPDNVFCEKLEADRVNAMVYQSTSYRNKGAKDEGGPEFSHSIEAKSDDIYYLMIHTNSTYKGKITVKYNRIGEIAAEKSVLQDFRDEKESKYIRIRIRDKATGQPVEANMIISGVGKDNYLFLGTDFYFDASTHRTMHIETNTQGYFLFVKDFKNMGPANNMEILIELERLAPGKSLAMENIKFRQDSDQFVQISYPALKRLLDFMAVNLEVRIQIQGHVNAPGYRNNMKIKKLSEDRAEAVKSYLVKGGIDESRIEILGLGNTQMLYEEPLDEAQEEANRRVEIKILE